MSFMSRREKQIHESVELMFHGMNDDALKEIILACALGKSEDEKEAICEKIRQQNAEEEERAKLMIPLEHIIEEEKKEADNVKESHEENNGPVSSGEGEQGLKLIHPDHLVYSA